MGVRSHSNQLQKKIKSLSDLTTPTTYNVLSLLPPNSLISTLLKTVIRNLKSKLTQSTFLSQVPTKRKILYSVCECHANTREKYHQIVITLLITNYYY